MGEAWRTGLATCQFRNMTENPAKGRLFNYPANARYFHGIRILATRTRNNNGATKSMNEKRVGK
jgi:hypothetical protein